MLYGWNQEKDAEVIFKQELIGNNPEEVSREFRMIQEQITIAKRIHFPSFISPTVNDGQQYT